MAVTLQLAVSVVFIIAASVVMMQMRFVNHKDLGFDRHATIQLSGLPGLFEAKKRTALMQELAAIPQIENITATDFEPAYDLFGITEVEWPGKPLHEKPVFERIGADSHFAETFRLKLRKGEWWNEGEKKKIVLNEEAVRIMGLREPTGTVIRMYPNFVSSDGNTPMQEYEVAGVVNDFHTLSLRSRIYPAIFMEPLFGSGHILYIRTVPGQEQEVIQRISAILPVIDATLDVRLTQLDELYDRLNHSEQVGLKIFSVMASVCLLISLFGIYAVAAASTQRRRKEVAIRKVVGAEVGDVVRLFFREYTLQVIIAGVIALPLAFFAMFRWLQGYAYRTDIPWWLPAGVIMAVVSAVLLTVLGQVLKTAHQNPAEVVKRE
jgi:putative ABC transport system permease protein